MVIEYLLPVPFLLAGIFALFRRDKWLGYVGSAAGIVTLLFVLQIWLSSFRGVASAEWFSAAGSAFVWSVLIDNLSLLLSAIVAGIGTFIFLYSVGYLEAHEDFSRYYAELALFASAMIGVITAANLFQLFFCWELVGVSSYLLIGFWHERESAIAAARKAFITIIIGDAFLLAGIFLLWTSYGTFDIQTILANAKPDTMTLWAGVCFIVGAISKSAQFPLHTWLPDAMEGPTPVSAFLHSATMVKAGLFLIVRMLPLIVLVGLSPLLIGIAVITILISACCALVETDVKRVLAYSTMNQLAFILLAIGLGATVAGLYHLLNHSIFKALLFMIAGIIIHAAGTQDMTKMRLKLGWNMLAICAAIGAWALAGLPPFSGFFSKDAIFTAVLESQNTALIAFFCVAIVLSAVYIFRWYFLIFSKNGEEAHMNWQMRLPLPILAFLTAIGGVVMFAFYSWWGAKAHFGIAMLISTILGLSGFLVAYIIYYKRTLPIDALASSAMAQYFRARFMLDDLYSALAKAVEEIGSILYHVDERVINRFLEGLARFFSRLAALLRRIITGRSTSYVTAIIVGFIVLLLFVRFA
jgi:NADH-quinone oxidoreductase subunit L